MSELVKNQGILEDEVEKLENSSETIALLYNPSSTISRRFLFHRSSLVLKVIAVIFILIVFYLLFKNFFSSSISQISVLFAIFHRHPRETLPLFIIINALAVIVFFPSSIFQVLAGVIFGFKLGLPVAWIGTILGYCGAYWAGQTFLRDRIVTHITRKMPKFTLIESALSREGWRLLFLLRIAPILPDSVMNYTLSIMSFDFSTFLITSAVALLPYSIAYVYTGSMSDDIVDLLENDHSSNATDINPSKPHSHTVTIISLVACIGVIVYITFIVKRAIRRALANSEIELNAVSNPELSPPEVDAYIHIPASQSSAHFGSKNSERSDAD